MNIELILNSSPGGVRIALLENKKLVEYQFEEKTKNFNVGDIYLGKVSKSLPGLNAAFVHLGSERDGFLHYLDLGPQFSSLSKYLRLCMDNAQAPPALENFTLEKDIYKGGKIAQVLQRNQPVLVQILKEPISTKGPRLCSEISIPGRFMVLVPFSNIVNVSKKITDSEERNRLRQLGVSLKPNNFGLIIRTQAEEKPLKELENDLNDLVSKWNEGIKKLVQSQPPQKIIGELNLTTSILRDMLNENFDNLVTDDPRLYEEMKDYIHTIAPEKENIIRLYTGKIKIFEHLGIEKQIKASFGKTVTIPGGGYLVIEHTEALHVIDVNSGNKANIGNDQEATAIAVNLDAAIEVCRQIRLRDLGGLIIVDFIDMRNPANRNLLNQAMLNEMNKDHSKNKILPLSKFGLMEITRQRVRPETFIKTAEVCPACNGTGNILPSILITDEIENNLEFLLKEQNEKSITIVLHPFLYAHYTKGLISKQMNWFLKNFKWIRLIRDSSLPITSYQFLNKNGEEISLK